MTGVCVAPSKFQNTHQWQTANARCLGFSNKALLASARVHTAPEADKPAPEALCSGDEAAERETQIPGTVELLARAAV